jgi:hypothetical protein
MAMPKAVFEVEVEVHPCFLTNGGTDEEIFEEARSIMFDAPAFDGLSPDMIEQLTNVRIEEDDD